MRNNLKLLSPKSNIVKLTLFILIVTSINPVFAGIETFNARLNAVDMQTGTTLVGVDDDKFSLIQGGVANFVQPSVKNRIILGVDQENTNFQSGYDLTFELLISYLDASSGLHSFTTNLNIAYDPQALTPYRDRNIYQFDGGHSVKAEIVKVYDENNGHVIVSPLSLLPINLFLEAEIEIERYYQFDPNYTSQILTITNNFESASNELILHWNHIVGAEEYDLEWTYVDDYDVTTYRLESELKVDFKNNSTRVTLNKNHYAIPLTFEHGYLLYRVRAVGRDINDVDFVLYGNWTAASGTSTVPLFVSNYTEGPQYFKVENLSHEENKNWQYSASYAEEGKKKEVISYFDGSLRTRQSVTKSNTNETAIVGETIYDNQGRGAVQVLPVPTNEAAIKYYEAFNKDDSTTQRAYSRNDFDEDAGTCSAGARPMAVSSGASNYYSVNNTNNGGVQAYIPNALKFPFTQVEYTPDNTGRIRRQSGVGVDHKLQSDHETKYFYAQPSQLELDQLFGSEVGDKAHYKQNAVVDANGQLSISYLDMQGRTIATSLAGYSPGSVDSLENGMINVVSVDNEDLFAKNALGVSASNQPNVPRNAIIFTTEKLIKTPGIYSFKYDIQTAQYEDPCLLDGLCFDCVYDLEISITDECGNYVHSTNIPNGDGTYPLFSPLIKTVGNINPFDIDCGIITFSSVDEVEDNINAFFPKVGVYSISKRLTINQAALDFYTLAYLDDANIRPLEETEGVKCFKELVDFETEWLDNVDYSGCNITCESCIASLGTEEEFITKGGTATGYANAVKECNELCDYTSLCEANYRTMLSDVSPGGQYAQLKLIEESPNQWYYQAYMYPLSIFNFHNRLPDNLSTALGTAYWRKPTSHYKDANGNVVKIPVYINYDGTLSVSVAYPSQVYTNPDGSKFIYPENFLRVDDFVAKFESSWAESLVQYHPEYCYYEWCSQNSTIYGEATETSDDFDYRLMGNQTLNEANQVPEIVDGVIVGGGFGIDLSTILDQDPFFNNGGIGTIIPSHWPTQFGSGIPWGTEPRDMMLNILNNYPTGDATLSPFSIYEIVAITQKCGTLFGGNQADAEACLQLHYPDAYSSCPAGTPFGEVCHYDKFINSTEGWNAFKGMYISAKQKVQQAMADEHAYWSCYNACIGWDEGNFWNWARTHMLSPYEYVHTASYPNIWTGNDILMFTFSYWTLGGPFYDYQQPCSQSSYNFYKDKVQRFHNIQQEGDQADILANMGNQGDFDAYYQTGVCPMARDLEYLLDALAKDDNLKVTGVQLQNYPQFSEELYNAVVDHTITPPTFVPFSSNPTISSSNTLVDNVLNLDFIGQGVDACSKDITLEFLTSTYKFSDLGTDFKIIKFNELKFTTGTTYDFTIKATIQSLIPTTPPTPPVIVTMLGSTCASINIGSCDFDDICETSEQAEKLLFLMEMLQAQNIDEEAPNTDSDIIQDFPLEALYNLGTYSNLSYSSYFNPIKDVLNPVGGENWHWKYNGNLIFTIYDFNSINSNKLEINFTTLPVFPQDITSILNIAPDPAFSTNNVPTNHFLMDIQAGTVISIAEGTISIVNGATITDFVVGTCAPPKPTACSTPENYRLDDFNVFLNKIIAVDGFDPTTPSIDLPPVTEYTELLATAAGTLGFDDVKWKNVTVSGTTLSADIEVVIPEGTIPAYTIPGVDGNPDIVMPEEVIPAQTSTFCNFSISFMDPATTIPFADIVSIDIQADETNLSEGYFYDFIGAVKDINNIKYLVKGTSCFALKNCTAPCIEENTLCEGFRKNPQDREDYNAYLLTLTFFQAVNNVEDLEGELTFNEFQINYSCCWDNYFTYATGFGVDAAGASNFFNPESLVYIPIEDFCEYKACASAHFDYLHYANTQPTWNLTSVNSPYFVSLADFCTYNEVYVNPTLATTNYQTYVNALIQAIGAEEAIIQAVSYVDFVKNNLGICLVSYIDALPEIATTTYPQIPEYPETPPTLPVSILEYCNGGYQVPVCTPTPPVAEFPTTEYVNTCAEEMEAFALLNAEGEYKDYIENITEDFTTAYKEKCLKAFENFTVSYNDKEHHFTLYYYDQAGNLIRTIPPQGVKRVTAIDPNPLNGDSPARVAADLAQINADRTFGTKTYFTKHTYPTTYEYNSLNQLVSQNVPDHNLINDITVTPSNVPSISGLTVTGVQYTTNGSGYAFANDGTNSYIYVTDDNGETWSQLSSVGNQDLNAVYMVDANNGYAVGENGILLKTNDGGNQWIEVTSFTTKTLNDVYFSDFNTGITVGENGTIFTTTDGGVNWSQITTTISGNILDIEFYDLNEGYAVVQEAGKGVIYAITGGGTTWISINNLKAADLSSVQLLTAQNAYAAGVDGQLLYTQNGGDTWELINNGLTEEFTQIHFKTTVPNVGCAITSTNKLMATTDGGATWINVVPSGLTNPQFVDFHFINSNDGYAVTNNGYVVQIDLTQGSSAWAKLVNSPVNTANNTIAVFFENSTTGYVSRSGGIIEKTTDKGATSWTQLPSLSTFIPTNSGAIAGVNTITAMHFDGNNGVIIADGKDYHTTNGGNLLANSDYDPLNPIFPQYFTTWDQGTLNNIQQMTFVDETEGYVRVTGDNLYKTTDVGLNWSTQFNSGSSVTLKDLDVLTSGEAIVVGDDGKIKITDDIGFGVLAMWYDKNIIEPQNLNSIAIDVDRGSIEAYVVGNDGKIFKSNDLSLGAASEWTLQPSATSVNFNAVDFMDPLLVSTVGEGGNVYTSTGGGWSSETTPFSNDLNDIYYYTASDAYAVGDGGDVIKRNGSAWVDDPNSNIAENLNGVYFGDVSTPVGIAVGDGGKIHRMDGVNTTCVTDVNVPVMNASQMVTNLIGYAVGEKGVILKTTDAGVSWNVLVSPPGLISTSLNAVFFTSPTKGYIVGDDGTYFTTTDGENWSSVTYPCSTNDLNDIYFADANHGVIVGNAGTVYYINTTISPNWNLANVNSVFFSPITGFNLSAVYFTNNVGFIVGSASTIFKSTDFGVSWEEKEYKILGIPQSSWTQRLYTSDIDLNDVYFADQYYGWAIGNDNIIIKTKDGGDEWEKASEQNPNNNLTAFNFNADGEAIIVGNSTGGTAIYQFTDQSDRFSSQFWYDKLGRLIISQNTKQNVTNINQLIPKYSYTLYDALGRIKEVGEIEQTQRVSTLKINNQIDETEYLNWVNLGVKKQITNTYYDLPLAGLSIPGFTQNNLRTRVAFTTFKSTYDADPLVYDNATHYSYDIHGNVDVLIQDNTALTDMNQRYKRMDYTYDLISGNVNEVAYQKGELDQFYHKYEYDADNRITNVYTSSDGVIWDQDAKYQYYLHGPLARTEIGDLKVQGLDYAYTIQGWLKGVNSNTLNKTRDIGKDGVTTNINQNVAQDEFGFTLGYFNGDYSAINSPASTNFEADLTGSNLLASSAPMYNGNITHMVTAVRAFMQGGTSPNATAYKYDQLNRLKEARTHNDAAVVAANQWGSATSTNDYGVKLTYDDNGNILTLKRNSYDPTNTNPTPSTLDNMDNLEYRYQEIGPRLTNRLDTVIEHAPSTGGTHIQPGILSFEYDEIGNLIQDGREEIENIEWSTYGKILKIERTATSSFSDLEFVYDASGNRITKIVKPRNGSGILPEKQWTYTHYVRDASGNVMSVYEKYFEDLSIVDHYKAVFKQKEVNLYGSSRIGMQATDNILAEREFTGTVESATGKIINPSEIGLTTFSGNSNIFSRYIGNKQYELTSHIGNVHVVISDRKLVVDANSNNIFDAGDYFTPDVLAAYDYYPMGGMLMPNRTFNSTESRYKYQGQESDDEITGVVGSHYNYRFRMSDSRLGGQFWSIDPLVKQYPGWSPYAFSQRRPIDGREFEGLEWQPVNGEGENVAPDADNIERYNWTGFTEPGVQIGGNLYREGQVPLIFNQESIDNAPRVPNSFGREGTVETGYAYIDGGNAARKYTSNRETQSGTVSYAALNQADITTIGGLNAGFQSSAKKLLLRANLDLGLDLRITEGFRSIATQNEYYSRSRTQAQLNRVGLNNVVAQPNLPWNTNAYGGQSPHNYGLAFDVVDRNQGYGINWGRLGTLGTNLGLDWGGYWRPAIRDQPHFQMTNWQQLIPNE